MRVLFGILLMGVGFVMLFAVIVIPVLPQTNDSAAVTNYLTPLLCNAGEKLIREQYQGYARDGGTNYSMTPYCVNSEHQKEDVTGRWVLLGVGGFLVPFLLGLLITIVSASLAQQRWLNQGVPNSSGGRDFAIYSSGNGVRNVDFSDGTLKVNGFEIKMDGLTQDKINALKAQMQTMSGGGGDLTSRLKQLQEAKDNGLITSDEYDRARQKILDDIG